jgi:sulfate adenylyltransferase
LLGATLFLVGLSGAGKSTLAEALATHIERTFGRAITLLDGDIVRTHLSAGLGFSREDRETNIKRVGFVAAEVTRHGGLAICALIAPFDSARLAVRRQVEPLGKFYLIYVATSLAVCESRDPKGLYAKARAGQLAGFTGISDPFEAPDDADILIDTAVTSVADAVAQLVLRLQHDGVLPNLVLRLQHDGVLPQVGGNDSR